MLARNRARGPPSPRLPIRHFSVVLTPTPTHRKPTMQILFINNNGGGFADYLDVAEDTTVGRFFADKMGHESSSNYLIRINRQPVANDYVLKPGDRVTFTPTKIEGARRRVA